MRKQLFLYLFFVLQVLSTVTANAQSMHQASEQSQPDAEGEMQRETEANTFQQTSVLDIRKMLLLDDIIKELSRQRVVFVGETHDQYSHHLLQLDIIKALHALEPDIAIGMEMFQQPFQQYLDAFINGELDERGMLIGTEYFDRWSFDYRLYRPILEFAREQKIPVVALNIEKEITSKVGDSGIDSLSDQEKAKIPADIDDSDKGYRDRMKKIFDHHPFGNKKNFEHFLQVQLLWDEGMAQQVTEYLKQHPERKMVVLAGVGHVEYGVGIPDRVERRLPVESAIVLPGNRTNIQPGIGDFVLFPQENQLPPAGLMGVFLGESGSDGVKVAQVAVDGAAAVAGVKDGDWICKIDGIEIQTRADIKIAMMDRKPDDRITVSVKRKRLLLGEKELEIELTLGQ